MRTGQKKDNNIIMFVTEIQDKVNFFIFCLVIMDKI
jgi:hypothetical protein